MSQTSMDGLLHSLRGLLNRDGIKLWLELYTNADGSKGEKPTDDLINKYTAILSVERDDIAECLENLRNHALEKLTAQKRFKETGEAKLKVKLTGQGLNDIHITINLDVCSRDLKKAISSTSGVMESHLKLICQGRILHDDKTLREQGVKFSSQIMAICLVTSEQTSRGRDDEFRELERIREAAEILSDKKDDKGGNEDEYYLQVADQNGKPLDLPVEERRALALAMTLHEKGRAFVKRKNHSLALLLLMEADEKFKQCRSSILSAVDNYALLCLDIVWTYLCLKNLDNLPDAEQRLQTCQECLDRSYGQGMSRVTSLKGSSGSECALYVRLHLLQAVLAYHQHRVDHAQRLLAQTQREIQSLTVNDELITQVVSLGFTEREARLGLRACQHQVDAAVNHIIRKREEREALRKKEKEERDNKKLSKKLGKTADGKWVDAGLYKSLTQMGFRPGAAAEALRQTNNNITNAIQVLQDQPELLTLSDPTLDSDFTPSDEQIAQILSMGFQRSAAEDTLKRHHGNLTAALNELLSALGAVPSTSSSSESGAAAAKKSEEQKAKEREAVEMIVDDIPDEEENYLDLSFEEEAKYLEEYSKLLALSD